MLVYLYNYTKGYIYICVCIYVSYISKGTSQLGKHVNGEIKEGLPQFLRKKKKGKSKRTGRKGRGKR